MGLSSPKFCDSVLSYLILLCLHAEHLAQFQLACVMSEKGKVRKWKPCKNRKHSRKQTLIHVGILLLNWFELHCCICWHHFPNEGPGVGLLPKTISTLPGLLLTHPNYAYRTGHWRLEAPPLDNELKLARSKVAA